MRISSLITKTQNKVALSSEEISWFVDHLNTGELLDYHVSAWLMAVYFNGLSLEETQCLTHKMRTSGDQIKKTQKALRVDKHSTGGVGDKTSLLIVPWLRVAWDHLYPNERLEIPMISGRGLGHTGGTLDKMESIPGFSPFLSLEQGEQLLREQGFFMMGQTQNLVPADKKLYALRDATQTVGSRPLIVSSILSKKLAENLDGLVIDLKYGDGAFLDSFEETSELGRWLISTAQGLGVKAKAVMTSMDEPLGKMAGNFVEMLECEEFFTEEGVKEVDPGLYEVTLELTAQMISLLSPEQITVDQAKEALVAVRTSKRTQVESCYWQMLESQGASRIDYEQLKESWREEVQVFDMKSPCKGFLSKVYVKRTGEFIRSLGGGRQVVSDKIDPLVGIEYLKKVGDPVAEGETVFKVYYREEKSDWVKSEASQLFEVSGDTSSRTKWIHSVMS